MEKQTTQKFLLENLDCTACAAKIERGLNKLDGVNHATIDFANLILHVEASDTHRIIDTVQRINPGVKVVPHQEANIAETVQSDGRLPVRPLVMLAIASLLFVVLLVGEAWLQQHGSALLVWAIIAAAYLLAGWNVLAGAWRTVRNRIFFDENVLMVIATVGAIAIHAFAEAVGVMIFYKIGEILQERMVSRSRRSIRALLSARPDRAMRETAHGAIAVPPEMVSVGELVSVRPGEKVPLDGVVVRGNSQVDTSPITGEFKPAGVSPGDRVLAGQINKTGLLMVRVTRPFSQSSIAKVMELVENAAARKAKTERFITTFARYYTPAVVFIAAGIAVIPPLLLGASFELWLYRALVLLVISCPCALVVSIPLGYFGGIGAASRQGVFVKGANYLDVLAALKTVVFDKTGTLTKGTFRVVKAVSMNGYSSDQLLTFAAAAEKHSNHPIAKSIIAAAHAAGYSSDLFEVQSHQEISGQGVKAEYHQHTIMIGNDQLLHRYKIEHDRCEFDATVAHVVVDKKYAGYILIDDEIKDDAHAAVADLRREGIEKVVLLTGDNACTAESVARKLNLDSVYSDLLPEHKVDLFDHIAAEQKTAGRIAFVGDGINDAPVIARADVGIAMGKSGSDAAIETADVVLMNDSPTKVAAAVAIAKKTRGIVWQNIVLAFTIKGVFIAFGAFGLATMWEAVFADVGTALLAVLNASRISGTSK